MGAYACDPLPSQRNIRAASVGRAFLGYQSLPMRQPAEQLCVQRCAQQHVQLRLQQPGDAANFEIDQLIQPPGGSPPRGEKEKRKPLCEGGHGPQLLLSISLIFCFFLPIFWSKAVWESERESRYENAARGCDAENPAQTARSTVLAPSARGHVRCAREGENRNPPRRLSPGPANAPSRLLHTLPSFSLLPGQEM